jgi:ABC-type branched-subunit amino acid transport system ATPase component/ABC-type branched-subunit amino acid transport system permease subunit
MTAMDSPITESTSGPLTRRDPARHDPTERRTKFWTERRLNVAIAALLFVALPLLTEHAMPKLLEQHHYFNLDVGVAMAVAAISLNLLLGYTGQISLGHAGLLAAGAFASGIMTSRWHASMVFGLLFAMAVGAAVAFVLGLPALRLGGLYLGIVTVIFGLAMQASILRSSVFSGGSAGVPMFRRIWGGTVSTDNALFLVVSLLLLLGVWLVDANVVHTRLGRAFRTIRENEAVAQAFGIPVTRYKLLAFVLSGAMAGLAGAMYGHTIGFVNNEKPFDSTMSLMLVIIVMVAGAGRRLAVVLAALLFWLFPSFIEGLHQWSYVLGAFLLMATVRTHPDGIADMLRHPRRPPRADADEDDELPALPQLPAPTRPLTSLSTAADVPLLEVQGVSVRFGGLTAVDDVSLSVPAGSVVGLIGPNGAGKSTLFNAISGLVRTESGRICLGGKEIQHLRCDQRASLGIARSFQHVGLARDLSVRDNFLLAQHQLAPYSDVEALLMLPRAAKAEQEFRARADEAIEALGFQAMADMPVRHLSGGQQRIVEIACLLVTAPELVMLDEPSAGMAPAAAENLASRLRDLRDALGRTVLLIEHNVPLVLDTCDYVYVLDAGRLIAEGRPAEIAANRSVIDAYFGAAV